MKKTVILIALIVIILLISNKDVNNVIIPNEAIRIRVIANSDSLEDQNLKKEIKKDLYEALTILLKDSRNIEDVRKVLNENLKGVEFTVKKSLEKNKVKEDFNINYGLNYFPNKLYKGVEYNNGYYESLVVTIGGGKGENWWCILFPPLCSLEIDNENIEKVEYKSFIKEIIDRFI